MQNSEKSRKTGISERYDTVKCHRKEQGEQGEKKVENPMEKGK